MQPLHTNRVTYERLENGVDVYALKTPALDVVTCMIAFPGGVNATYNRQTVALLLGEIMPGSTNKRSKNLVLETFEKCGAKVAVSVDNEHLIVTLASRKSVFFEALRLVFEVVTKPRFSQKEFREATGLVKAGLVHSREDTRYVATNALTHTLYRKGHPQWSPDTRVLEKELLTVKPSEVLSFHKETLSSVGALLCIVGDVEPKKVMRDLRALCTGLPSRPSVRASKLHTDRVATPLEKDVVLSLRDKMNVDTLLGVPLMLTRDSDDYLALQVAVGVLGGSSNSRLFNTLRTRMSLTYSSRAGLAGFRDGYPGYLLAEAIFPNDVFLRARGAFRDVVREFVLNGITRKELVRWKEEIAGKHKVSLASTSGMCTALFSTLLQGKPASYVEEYPTLVEQLSLREVNDAISVHIAYEQAVTAAAGAIDKKGNPLT